MSGEGRRSSAPQGPPWSPELLADLHAGALDEQTAAELNPLVLQDPEAAELLAALDATAAQLGEEPEPAIPDAVADRIEAALTAAAQDGEAQSGEAQGGEAQGRGPQNGETAAGADPHAVTGPQPVPQHKPEPEAGGRVLDLAAARRRRSRRALQVGGVLAGAAAVAGAIVLTNVQPERNSAQTAGADHSTEPGGQESLGTSEDGGQYSGGQPTLAVQGDQVSLSGPQLSEVLGTERYGALSRPEQLVGCLQANGVTSGKPIGAREITLNGEPAQLLIVPAGRIGQFRLLAVGPECGPDRPATLSDSIAGG